MNLTECDPEGTHPELEVKMRRGAPGLWEEISPSGRSAALDPLVDWDNVSPDDQGMPGFVARVNIDPTDHDHLIVNLSSRKIF